MKQIFILTAALLTCMGMRAQDTGIDSVLRQIEANNKELQANAQLISSQKLENKAENNLPDPTLSYAHLWDSKNSDETVGEMVVSQSFDFPTLYVTRGKMNRLKTGALDAQAATMRQQILLQAKEVCPDILLWLAVISASQRSMSGHHHAATTAGIAQCPAEECRGTGRNVCPKTVQRGCQCSGDQ